MSWRSHYVAGWALGLGFVLWAGSAPAVITRLTPLREVLKSEQLIFLAKVEKLDLEKPSLALQVVEDLKGKAPFRKLPVNLTADSQGQREKHTAKLLKRLAPNLTLVVFCSKRDKRYTAFAYTNGTWFQMIGQPGEDATLHWSFTHCEPYLRRTYKGTTAELEQVIRDGLAGKKDPPAPDAREPPGLGPELKKEKGERRKERGESKNPLAAISLRHSPFAFHLGTGPILAVIPTFVILGPLALLATLFPAVFGGLALLMRRWLVLLSIAGIDSTLYLAHAWLRGYLKESWLGSPPALWTMLTLMTLIGVLWSGRRRRAAPESAAQLPRRGEQIILWIVSLIGLVVVLACVKKDAVFSPLLKDLSVIWTVAWVGALYTLYLRWSAGRQAPRQAPAVERIMLWALVFACAGRAASTWPRHVSEGVEVVWTFEPIERGAIISSPLVDGNRVYVAAIQSAGFSNYGAVYALDRQTGKQVWKFDDEGGMLQVFSSPCVADGRLFIGEGLHENQGCRFFCLDARTGKKFWHFATSSHTESSPCVADGKVFFGAGDDGVYCLDAASGEVIWHFAQPLHVDASPIVVDKHLYCGSGTSRTHKATEIFCLDTRDGSVEWRRPTELPVWASPAADGGQIFFGLGNGRFDQSAQAPEEPAGAVLCVEATTGQPLWQAKVSDAVLVKPAVDREHVYFGARDHHCYCVDRLQGEIRWKQDLGSPIVAAPALLEQRLYIVASEGKLCSLDVEEGRPLWTFDAAVYSQAQPQLYSSPAVAVEWHEGGPQHRIYLGAELKNAISSAAMLFCLSTGRQGR